MGEVITSHCEKTLREVIYRPYTQDANNELFSKKTGKVRMNLGKKYSSKPQPF